MSLVYTLESFHNFVNLVFIIRLLKCLIFISSRSEYRVGSVHSRREKRKKEEEESTPVFFWWIQLNLLVVTTFSDQGVAAVFYKQMFELLLLVRSLTCLTLYNLTWLSCTLHFSCFISVTKY